MRVLLDTNFLIDVVRFKIDLEDITGVIGYSELVTLSSVEKELTTLSKKASKAGAYAKTALKFVKENKIKILKSNERPDNALVKLADENTIIATNDIELRKGLKASGRKTIYLKSKKHLAIG
ncbi:MAG: PIN domain-containing protein [Candidatus Aenigmatarchaeota archaeon]